MDALERVGADAVGAVWVGTYATPDGRVAVVTHEAPSRELAVEAARRWVVGGEHVDLGIPHSWTPSERYPGRFEVFVEGRLGRKRVALETP